MASWWVGLARAYRHLPGTHLTDFFAPIQSLLVVTIPFCCPAQTKQCTSECLFSLSNPEFKNPSTPIWRQVPPSGSARLFCSFFAIFFGNSAATRRASLYRGFFPSILASRRLFISRLGNPGIFSRDAVRNWSVRKFEESTRNCP